MNRIKTSIWALLFASILLPAVTMAQSTAGNRMDSVGQRHELSIQQAVDYANKNNVQVKNAVIDLLLQKETNRQITAAAYPSINASGNLTDNLKLQTTLLPGELAGQPAGTFVPVTFGTKYITNAGVDLNQILFDGQVFVGLQARRTSIDWAKKSVEVTQQTIKTNVYKVYYQLIASKTQIDLLDSNISLLRKQQRDAQIMYDNGFAEKLDVDRATVGLANLQTEKDKVLTTIANGYYGLKVLLGMPMNDVLILTDTLNEQELRKDVLDASNYAYNDRKDYQYLQLSRDLNAYNIRRYKLSKIPTVSLGANYSKQYLDNKFGYNKNWFTSSYVALRINVPIFKGFETNSKIAAARLEVQKLDNQLSNMRNSIDNDVYAAKNNFTTAISSMDYQRTNMELAQRIYNQTKRKFEEGLSSSTDLATAQRDLQLAQTNYVNALYDAIVARVDYFNATGKL